MALTEEQVYLEMLKSHKFLPDMLMSNFDHSIDDGLEEALKTEETFSGHAGQDFNGHTWFKDGQFHEAVCCYHILQGIESANSLRELMEKVNDKYGWD